MVSAPRTNLKYSEEIEVRSEELMKMRNCGADVFEYKKESRSVLRLPFLVLL